MLFNFPKKQINDASWFVSSTNLIVFGMIKLITVAISEDSCKTYYRMIDDADTEYTIMEEQLLENNIVVPTPRYAIGDGVTYAVTDKDNKADYKIDIIKHVEISFYEKDYAEITYVMEHADEGDWVLEEEILGYGEMKVSEPHQEIETQEDNYTEYQHYSSTGASDV